MVQKLYFVFGCSCIWNRELATPAQGTAEICRILLSFNSHGTKEGEVVSQKILLSLGPLCVADVHFGSVEVFVLKCAVLRGSH